MPSEVVDFYPSLVVFFLKVLVFHLQFFVLLVAGLSFLLELCNLIVPAFQLICQQFHLLLVSDALDSETLVGTAHHGCQIGRSDPADLIVSLLYLVFHSCCSVLQVFDHHVLFDESCVDLTLEFRHLALEHFNGRVLFKCSLLVFGI